MEVWTFKLRVRRWVSGNFGIKGRVWVHSWGSSGFGALKAFFVEGALAFGAFRVWGLCRPLVLFSFRVYGLGA